MEVDFTEYKKKVLDVYKAFDAFCTANNLRFYAVAGTLLGAVRHQGFIPWDDDIDIVMPRPDYDKFIALTLKTPIEGFDVLSMHTSKDYYLEFAKFVDANTTLIEEPGKSPIGIFIDIFPLDGMPRDKKLRTKQDALYHKYDCARHYMLAPSGNGIKGFVKTLRKKLYWLLYSDASNVYKKMEGVTTMYPFEGAKDVRVFCGYYADREVLDKSIFDKSQRLPFEDTTIPCVEKTEYYLTRFYGDYMQLPPKEQQVTHHFHHFLDMNRRWSEEELKKAGII